MPLGAAIGLGLGHIVLDVDLAPPRKGAQQPSPTSRRMSKLVLQGSWLLCRYITYHRVLVARTQAGLLL